MWPRRLTAIRDSIAAEWAGFGLAGLQFWHRDTGTPRRWSRWWPIAVVLLLIRSALTRTAGRHHLVVPALLRSMPSSSPVVDAPRAARAVPVGLPVRAAGAGRSVFGAGRRGRDVSGPPHQPDDRRVDSMPTTFKTETLNTRIEVQPAFFTTVAAAERFVQLRQQGQVPRSDGAGRVRQPGLRDHAVHQRLRQHPAQHRAHQRSGGVLAVSRIGHGDRAARSNRASRSSRRSTFSKPRAT